LSDFVTNCQPAYLNVYRAFISAKTATPGQSRHALACTPCLPLSYKLIQLPPSSLSSISSRRNEVWHSYLSHNSESDSALSFSHSLFDIDSFNAALRRNYSLLCTKSVLFLSTALSSRGTKRPLCIHMMPCRLGFPRIAESADAQCDLIRLMRSRASAQRTTPFEARI
jgi:hypothetical protein